MVQYNVTYIARHLLLRFAILAPHILQAIATYFITLPYCILIFMIALLQIYKLLSRVSSIYEFVVWHITSTFIPTISNQKSARLAKNYFQNASMQLETDFQVPVHVYSCRIAGLPSLSCVCISCPNLPETFSLEPLQSTINLETWTGILH